jgi:hypothetical protein
MNVTPKIIFGEHGDQFPSGNEDIMLYFRIDGTMYLRYFGTWKKMFPRPGAGIGSEKWLLLANVETEIVYKKAFAFLPTVSWSCYAKDDPNTHLTPRFTALSKTGMSVMCEEDAWFYCTASPNMRSETQSLELPYAE